VHTLVLFNIIPFTYQNKNVFLEEGQFVLNMPYIVLWVLRYEPLPLTFSHHNQSEAELPNDVQEQSDSEEIKVWIFQDLLGQAIISVNFTVFV
jgi:hypothetical protein